MSSFEQSKQPAKSFILLRDVIPRREGARSTPAGTRWLLLVPVLIAWPVYRMLGEYLQFKISETLAKLIAAAVASSIIAGFNYLAYRVKRAHELLHVVPERDQLARTILEDARGDTPCQRPFAVFLRPFRSDSRRYMQDPRLVGARGRGKWFGISLLAGIPTPLRLIELEEVIADALDYHYPLIAVGGREEVVGAGRIATSEWQQIVQLLAEQARMIFFIPSESPGCDWEIQHLIERRLLDKILFIIPPAEKRSLWEEARKSWTGHRISLPPYDPSGAVFAIDNRGEVCWLYSLSDQHLVEIRRRLLAFVNSGGVSRALSNDSSLGQHAVSGHLPSPEPGVGARVGYALGLKIGRIVRRIWRRAA